MGALWCARKWRLLLNLIDHLPRDSFYREALATDEEIAELWADQELPKFEQRFSESSPVVELLRGIYNRLGLAINATVVTSGHGNKPLNLDSWPQPVSAISKAQERRKHSTHEALVRRLLPPE